MAIDLSGYKDVAARILDFKSKHPKGSLQSEYEICAAQGFVIVKGYAYRSPDDPRPGTGLAWERFPGLTPYTKDSELQNAETSAWGRAIVAALASESKAVASAEDVRNRAAEAGQSEAQRVTAAPVDRATEPMHAIIAGLLEKLKIPTNRVRPFCAGLLEIEAKPMKELTMGEALRLIDALEAQLQLQESSL